VLGRRDSLFRFLLYADPLASARDVHDVELGLHLW
jgi:hypothetical protein